MLQLTKLLTQNKQQFQVAAIIVIALVLLWVFGCQPKTQSLFDPAKKVTGMQLQAELEFYISLTESKFADLHRQARIRQILFENAALIATGGSVNLLGLFTSLGSILAVGASADNVRLRRERKKLKSEA